MVRSVESVCSDTGASTVVFCGGSIVVDVRPTEPIRVTSLEMNFGQPSGDIGLEVWVKTGGGLHNTANNQAY